MTDNPIPVAVDPVRLWEILDEHFTFDELHNLCFALGIDFESLPGDGKKSKAREIVIYCRNRATMEQLVGKVRQERPGLGWDEAPAQDPSTGQNRAESADRRLYSLVTAFNRNRHQPRSSQRTRMGDEITFRIRELVPELDGRFEVAAWLNSANMGKRIAAIEYLDWKQDTEYLGMLLDKLSTEQPFIQFHILITISSMLDQLGYNEMQLLRARLKAYDPEGDASRNLWSRDLQNRVEDWFRLVE